MKNHSAKPGSSLKDAQKLGGSRDFGVPESNISERTYTSQNTRQSDPGGSQARSGTNSRESGVGAPASGPGSASGGDVDTEIAVVGTGRGLSQTGPDKNYQGGPDEAQQTSSGRHPKPAPKQNLNAPGQKQSTISRAPDNTPDAAQGADAATNPKSRHDDSFAGEVSSDEATGRNDA